VSMFGLTNELTSPFKDFSPTSTFHAGLKPAFTKLLDLAFAMVLHIVLSLSKISATTAYYQLRFNIIH
jgi:hypothetical protein